MRLLMTGATGFVGRNLLLKLVRESLYTEIVVPVRSKEKLTAQFQGDGFAELPAVVKPVVMAAHEWDFSSLGQFTHVVHLAGTLTASNRKEFFDTNVEGTLKLLSSIGSPQKVLILSSQAAAGPCAVGMSARREQDAETPVTWYGESKLEMEKRVKAEFSHLNYLILRPPMVLGARDAATLPLFKMARQPVQFKPSRNLKWYSFIAVTDLVEAIVCALKSEKFSPELSERLYFVSHDTAISDREMIKEAVRAVGRDSRILPIPERVIAGVSLFMDRVPSLRGKIPNLTPNRVQEIWPNRWVVTSEGFERRFSWKAKQSLAQVCDETYAWYQSTGQFARVSPLRRAKSRLIGRLKSWEGLWNPRLPKKVN